MLTSDAAEDIMATLPDAGAVGIGMFPEGLRHPFGFDGVLTGPDAYQGKVMRAAASEELSNLYEALGATTTDDEPDPAVHVGADSSYLLKPFGTAAGNVTFYPKVNVLVAGTEAWEDLSEPQQAVLQKAAANTLKWSQTNVPDEAAAAEAFCAQGGQIAVVDESDVKALEKATAPVAAKIAATGTNAQIVAQIEEMRDGLPAPVPVTSCDPGSGSGTVDASALNGIYRYEITAAGLGRRGRHGCANVIGELQREVHERAEGRRLDLLDVRHARRGNLLRSRHLRGLRRLAHLHDRRLRPAAHVGAQ